MSVGHYENFPVASRLVPAHLRPAIVAIYRFARAADDIADEGDAAASERLAGLAAFDRSLDAIGRGETPAEPPFAALAEVVRAHQLPIAPLYDLISAFRQDVTVGRYATYADLQDYCRRSANPVGRMLLALYRAESPANCAASDAVCTGLQLTNFWQDVAIDWRKNRVYLPQEDFSIHSVHEDQIAAGQADSHWRALMAFEVARARALLEAGRPLARAFPWRLGLELTAVINGGLRILERIDAVHGDVFTQRPKLTLTDWALVSVRTAIFPLRTPRVRP